MTRKNGKKTPTSTLPLVGGGIPAPASQEKARKARETVRLALHTYREAVRQLREGSIEANPTKAAVALAEAVTEDLSQSVSAREEGYQAAREAGYCVGHEDGFIAAKKLFVPRSLAAGEEVLRRSVAQVPNDLGIMGRGETLEEAPTQVEGKGRRKKALTAAQKTVPIDFAQAKSFTVYDEGRRLRFTLTVEDLNP